MADGRASVGTGFFYAIKIDAEKQAHAILTNKHVLKDAVSVSFQMTKASDDGKPLTGEHTTVKLDNYRQFVVDHPDPDTDLCAILVGPIVNQAQQDGTPFFYVSLDDSILATPDDFAEFSALEEVIMVGYPNGLWDSVNNMPVFRKGVTATHPSLDYEGRPEFLIDMACFQGSSGSPVLLYNVGAYSPRSGGLHMGTRIKLLGVLYAGPQFTTEGELKIVPVPTVATKPVAVSLIPMNVGVVLKSSRIHELAENVAKLVAASSGS